MKSLRIAGIVIVAGGLVGLVVYIYIQANQPRQPTTVRKPFTPKRFEFNFRSSADCLKCHKEIAKEWNADQHSMAWFNNTLPQDPNRTECIKCHASLPILETGLDKMPKTRFNYFKQGIGCFECHVKNTSVHGPLPAKSAPCNPVLNKVFIKTMVCAPCHAPHGTIDEWKASSWGKKGITCQACHMPYVNRPSSTGGKVHKVRSHKMLSQRDPEFLQNAVSVKAEIKGKKLVISITNDNTGHNFPGEIFNRVVFLKTEIFNAQGERLVTHRDEMKTPPRPQRSTEHSTQIKSGETRRYSYELPQGKLTIKMFLGYKLFFMHPDVSALKVWEGTLIRK